MAEKRKPVFIILLRRSGKKKFNSVEIFSGKDWNKSDRLFRLRVNGKWFPEKKFELYYKSKIKEMVFRSCKF